MGTLAEATALASTDGGGFALQLDPAWSGWGPAGGYLAAIALRAAGRSAGAGHRPVTMSCQFLSAAKDGGIEIAAEVAKPGATACTNIALSQAGRRFFQAQVWTTSRAAGPDDVSAVMPDVPAPDAVAPLETHLRASTVQRVRFWSS